MTTWEALKAKWARQAAENAERERLDMLWYKLGYYELFGCDRHGRVSTTVDDEADDNAYEDAATEREVAGGREFTQR